MSTSSQARIVLPVVTIQPTFKTVIAEVDSGIIPSETFWVSCYKRSQPSVHAKIHVQLDETYRDVVNLVPKDGDVQIERRTTGRADSYTIACPTLGIPHTPVILPEQEYADPERSNLQKPQRITAFDISPDGSQFSTGFHDGSVHIYPVSPTPNRSIVFQKYCKPHLSSVTSLRFFPSSRVLLTAGADFSLTILPADPTPLPLPIQDPTALGSRISPVRTLRGHTRSISDTAIISRGRNILSGSSDGTIRLWDVSGGQQIRMMTAGNGRFSPVSSISLGERGETEVARVRPDGEELGERGTITSGGDKNPRTTALPVDEREVDTANKILFCALGNGSFEVFDLGSKRSVFHSKVTPEDRPAGLSSITYSPTHNMLATGSTQGTIVVYDTRSLTSPLTSFSRNGASIEDLALVTNFKFLSSSPSSAGSDNQVNVAVAAQDGLSFVAGVRPEGPRVLAELAGVDCDGVRAVRICGRGDVWTAADDGVVRRY